MTVKEYMAYVGGTTSVEQKKYSKISIMEYSDKELLSVLATRLRSIVEDMKRLTTGNLAHNGCAIRGRLLRNAELIEKHLNRINTTKVDSWHKQSEEDIYDAVKDWGLYTFACIMKDGTVQRFNGCLDEDCEGHIHVHIDGVNDDYDNVDDIVKWIEIT